VGEKSNEPAFRYPAQFVRVGVAGYKGEGEVTDNDPEIAKQRQLAIEDKARKTAKTK
jgi:hypothetical protein